MLKLISYEQICKDDRHIKPKHFAILIEKKLSVNYMKYDRGFVIEHTYKEEIYN
jgi:hypothetical protein